MLCIGSVSYDLVFQVDRMPHEHEKLRCANVHQSCGGSAANTAYWLARLGHHVEFAGCVGDDELGRKCIAELQRANVKTDDVQVVDNTSTGIATVFTSARDKRMVTARGANNEFDVARLDLDNVDGSVHVHLSMGDDDKAIAILREVSRRGASVSCEFNDNQTPERVQYSRICFMNFDELQRWMGDDDPIGCWTRAFPNSDASLVVTQGSTGAVCVEKNNRVQCPAASALVVDRTGGGDAFDAGYLHAVSHGMEPPDALKSGLKLAAMVIGHVGATPKEISGDDLTDLLAVVE